MKNLKHIAIATCILVHISFGYVSGQDLLELPEQWENATYDILNKKYVDLKSPENRVENYWELDGRKTAKNIYWRVSASREGIPLFDLPNGSKVGELKLGETQFVLNEHKEYIKLSGLDEKPIGWCHKKDLILWKTPLLDINTGIEIKAFMVNKFSGSRDNLRLIMSDKERYQIYDGPGPDANVIGKELIYDVFFVFKYENPSGIPGKGRYLVSQHFELSDLDVLLGWVNEDRLTLWTTSICIEPNFEPEALEERNKKGIIATVFPENFVDPTDMANYRKTGEIEMALVTSELRDPAMGDYKKDPRMYGRIFRYPVFQGKNYVQQNNCRFRTGIAGKFNLANTETVEGFNDRVYTMLKKKRERLQDQIAYQNIIFVLDGTDGMARYFQTAAEIIDRKVESNMIGGDNKTKYGAVIYRNEFFGKSWTEDPEDKIITTYELSPDGKTLARDLKKEALQCGERVPSATKAVYYGLEKALDLCRPDQTNIIIHVGHNPDNSSEFLYYDPDKAKTHTTPNDIANAIPTDVEIHFINFVGYSENVENQQRKLLFSNISNGLLPELSAEQSNKYAGIDYYENYKKPEAPVLSTSSGSGYQSARMANSPFQIKSYFLNDYNLNIFKEFSLSEIDSCSFKAEKFLANLESVVEDDSPLSDRASEFSLAYLDLCLQKLLEEDSDNAQVMKEFKEWAAREKVQLFVESGTYYRTEALNNPLFKYVIFMNKDDLDQKIDGLRDLSSSFGDGSSDADMRKALTEYWAKIGESVLGGGSYKGKTPQELKARIYGIEDLDIIMPDIYSLGEIEISDIEKSKRLSPGELEKIRRHVKTSYNKLVELLESDYYYQVEDSRSKFYWVPFEYLY